MKLAALTLALVTLWFSTGCTSTPSSVTVSPDGTISATGAKKLGGKNMIYAKNDKTTVIIGDNNVESFKDFNKSLRFGAGVWGATDIFNTVTGGYTSVKNAKTAADVSKTGLVEGTKVVGLQEVTKQKALDIEALALEAGQ